MFSSVLVVFSVVLALAIEVLGQAQQMQLAGCITEIPNGGLQFEANPSRSVYPLQGDSTHLTQYVNHWVKISVSLVGNKNSTQAQPALIVHTIDVLNESCTSRMPSQKAAAVVGKAGEGQVAVPVTTSASAGETTPGFQTETLSEEEPPNNGQSLARKAMPSYAPTNTAQAAQSAAAANRYAEVATQSEIQPGNTLGATTNRQK